MTTDELQGFLGDLKAFREELDDWERRQLDALFAVAVGTFAAVVIEACREELEEARRAWKEARLSERVVLGR